MKLEEIQRIDRPDRKQVTLIVLSSLLTTLLSCGMAAPFVVLALIPMLIRYWTTRYRFDEGGVGVSHGFLFRQESQLTFDKIQDIHLRRGFLERWLGLGTVDVQTASGSAMAEVSLYGLTEYDEVRDFLYERMRDARGTNRPKKTKAAAPRGEFDPAPVSEGDSIALLREIRDEVKRLQAEAAALRGGAETSSDDTGAA